MKKVLLCFSIFLSTSILLFAQKTISGIVKNENGEPLIGTSIIWDGQSGIGTVSNLDGSFYIDLPEQKGNLTFIYIGYASVSIDISRISNLPITLLKETQDAPEIDLGMHAMKIAKTIGTITFEQDGNEASGLRTNSGNAIVRVRGKNVDKENQPLVILDGVEQDGTAGKTFEEVIPSTIKSIEVLKGEKAIEKYGDKGKNGVIIVTSK